MSELMKLAVGVVPSGPVGPGLVTLDYARWR